MTITRAFKPVSVKISRSKRADKKWVALFEDADKRTRKVHFGAKGMSDYTLHKDEGRKKKYIARHTKNESWNDPMSAGALSRWILWELVSFKDAIKEYKKRFGLK